MFYVANIGYDYTFSWFNIAKSFDTDIAAYNFIQETKGEQKDYYLCMTKDFVRTFNNVLFYYEVKFGKNDYINLLKNDCLLLLKSENLKFILSIMNSWIDNDYDNYEQHFLSNYNDDFNDNAKISFYFINYLKKTTEKISVSLINNYHKSSFQDQYLFSDWFDKTIENYFDKSKYLNNYFTNLQDNGDEYYTVYDEAKYKEFSNNSTMF